MNSKSTRLARAQKAVAFDSNVSIGRASAARLKYTLETEICNYGSGLEKLHGPALVERWRTQNAALAKKYPQDKDHRENSELMEQEIFPVYLDLCGALAVKAAPAEPGLIDLPVRISRAQMAIFEEVNRLTDNGATAAQTILALACSRVEFINGDGWFEGLQELGCMLWRFNVQHEVPENNAWAEKEEVAS